MRFRAKARIVYGVVMPTRQGGRPQHNSNMSGMLLSASLILAQEQRWRRA
ncbi:MAG: hypothetical protein AVDCRST_MAG18-3152 [uncultured Thermomicrobiales bacterium]|uniref:Uncharacterized protein n=1 Tax=uncultured Thermomicrobiales bacterium TaxID=1645740 RepID=A0A6J4VJA2_9BACT|nr:MAG: hypothetical protein AVDCRST_MAG18-3152 [uncultured Thermomicrobiales bacterium]